MTMNIGRRAGLALAAATIASTAIAADEATELAVASYPSPTSAWLSWASDAAADGSSFRVERRAVGSRAWYPLATLPGGSRSHADSGLRNASAYEYRVVTLVGGAALVSPQTVVLATPAATATQAEYDAAAAPRNVDAQAVSPTEVIVTWADQTPDETHFRIERRQGAGPWNAVATVPANAALFKDANLTPGASYEYRVAAERAGQLAATSAPKAAATPPTGTANWLRYVDGSACNTGTNAGTQANPWKSIQTAAYAMRAGQTLLVRNRADCATPTVYRTTPNAAGKHAFTIVDISNDAASGQFATGGQRSGTPAAWITYRNYPGERPKLRTARGGLTSGGYNLSDSGNYNAISLRNVSYIVIDGFEIEGHLNDVTLDEATALNAKYKSDYLNPPVPPAVRTPIAPVVDGSGISVGSTAVTAAQANQMPHHIVLRNNVIHDMPGSGIAGIALDWLTVENNRVTNTSWYSPYGTSLISVLRAKDVDANTSDYKIVIRGNYAADGGNLFPSTGYRYIQQTDGNGIILDTFRNTTDSPALPAYAGRSLVMNNIVTNNGGRGVHSFGSENADIVFNTLVRNSTIAITGEGEISVQRSRNVRAYNNIAVARTDRPTHIISFQTAAAKLTDAAGIDVNHNLFFGGDPNASQVQVTPTQAALGPNNRLNLDPKFTSGSGVYAFRLQANSPAVNTAASTATPVPANDILLAPRPRGSTADVGAVESF